MSRTPVRETLLQLQEEGFPTLEENRGFFVTELTERDARELYPTLHALEDALVSGGRLSQARLRVMEETNRRLADARDPEQAIRRFVRICYSPETREQLRKIEIRGR